MCAPGGDPPLTRVRVVPPWTGISKLGMELLSKVFQACFELLVGQ